MTGVEMADGRVRAVVTHGARPRSPPRSSSTPPAPRPATSGGWPGSRPGRADQAPVRRQLAAAARRRARRHARPSATPTRSSTSAARRAAPGGLLVGGYIRDTVDVLADGGPPLAEPRDAVRAGPGQVRRVVGRRAGAGSRRCARRRSPRSCTGRRRSRPTASSCSARPRSPASGWRPGFCVHGLAAAGGVGKVHGRVDRRRHAGVGRVHMDIRRFGAHAASRSWATREGARRLLPLLRRRLPPRRSGRPAGRCAARAIWPRTTRARRSARRPAGNGSTGSRVLPRGPAAPARPAGWAGPQLVARDRRRVPGHRRRRRACSTSPRSRSSTSAAPARPRSCSGCAPTTSTARSAARLHPAAQRARRHRGRPDGDPAGRGPLPHRHQHRLRRARRRLAPPPRARGRPDRRRDRRLRLPVPVGPGGPGHPGAAGRRTTWTSRSCGPPAHRRPGAGAGPAGHVRRRVRLGAVRPRRVHADAVGPAGRGGRAARPAPGGYRAIDSMRLEKGYRVWGSDITPETTPDEAGLVVRGPHGQGLPGPRRPCGAATAAAPPALPGAGRPGHRLPGHANRSGWTASRSAGSPPAASATGWSAPSPTPTCPPRWRRANGWR